MSARPTGGDGTGAVLVFVVLLMLALFALGHGLLVASLGEVAASAAGVRHLAARVAAEGAVAAALRAPRAAWMDSVVAGSTRAGDARALGRATAVVIWRRLARESWLVEGRAELPGRAEVRAARLAWALDPLERVAALRGVLNAPEDGAWALDGLVDAAAPTAAVPPLDPAACASWLPELEARYADGPLSATAVLPDAARGPALGLLDVPALLAGAPALVSGAGTPGPTDRFGACVEDAPWGWGDPDGPSEPCGAHLPLRASAGDLTVVGGVGQGVLVVDGDLTLTSGARFHGLVIARGALHVEGSATLEGLALAWGGGSVAADARVRGSACWAVRALAAQLPTLGGPIAVPGVGLFGPL
jgi:hypothetical protein